MQKEIFQQALEDTKPIIQRIREKILLHQGREHDDLIRYRIAKPSGESFADWMAFKAIELRIKRMKSVEERRQYVAETGAFYCEPPGPLKDFPHLTAVEKEYSYEVHGDNRIRRLSVFTSAIRELVQCEFKDKRDVQSFGDCEL